MKRQTHIHTYKHRYIHSKNFFQSVSQSQLEIIIDATEPKLTNIMSCIQQTSYHFVSVHTPYIYDFRITPTPSGCRDVFGDDIILVRLGVYQSEVTVHGLVMNVKLMRHLRHLGRIKTDNIQFCGENWNVCMCVCVCVSIRSFLCVSCPNLPQSSLCP